MSEQEYKYSAKCLECECGLASDKEFVLECQHGVWVTEKRALTGVFLKPLHFVAAHQAKPEEEG